MTKFKTALKRFLGFFPSALPVGLAEFNIWSQSIIDTYKPAADDDSVRFALCAMIQHLNPTEAFKSKRYFALCLHKGAAAQVAAGVMYDMKQKQKALEAAKLTEATVQPTAASNGTSLR